MCIIHIMTSREIVKKLKAAGWFLFHIRGDHHQFKHKTKSGKVTVIHPVKDIPIDVLKSIFEQAGWNWRQR